MTINKNSYPGKLIVFEGLDGSGHSTQLKLVRDFLVGKGINVLSSKEPTVYSEAGKKIKKVLDKEMKADPEELQDLFIEDRRENTEKVVLPALKEGKYVLLDRYFFSTLAYGAAEGLSLEELIEKNREFILPDLTLIFDVSAKTCILRIEKRGMEKTLFEKEKQLSKVLDYYKKFPSLFDNVFLIDGEGSIEDVFEETKKVVLSQVLNRKEK